jgi:hypothetical protein
MKRYSNGFVLALVAALAMLGLLPAAALAFPFVLGATETTTGLDELMKITFDDTLISEVVTDTELLDLLPDGEVKRGPEGRHFETSQLYQNPGSIGSRAENGYIPVPNGAKAVNAKINLQKIMGAIEETAEVLKKIRTDKAAFVNWAKEQFPRFKESLSDELDRQALGDGSGIRARVNAAAPATTLVVDSTFGIAGLNNALMQFRRGMYLRASANADGSTPRAGVMTVTDIDWANDAIKVDALATGLADNDYLFEGDAADNSAGKDTMGLLGLIDDGGIVSTLQQIDRTVHLWFQSYVNDQATDPLTEDLVIDTDKTARFRGGGRADTIIASEDAFNTLWRDLRTDRIINDPRAYTAGRKGIDILFGGTRTVHVRTARKMPSKLIFGLQRDQLRKFVLHEWEWDDTTGSIWKQVVDSTGRKDAFYAYGSMYGELAIKSPQRCWRLEGWANAA